MSNVINQNLDEIISIKNQLSNVLIENGVEAGNRFSDYPDMFRSVIASGGSFNPSYYYTADYIDENFVSYSYASANYVSYSYAYNTFVSYAYLGDLEQISEYILGSGSSSAPENIYATKVELASYATKTELGAYVSKISLESMSYITMDDVSACGYITASDIPSVVVPVIDENLIPKETGTYTLGDSSHLYAATYTKSLNINNPSRNGWTISSEGSGNEMQLKPFNTQRTFNIIDYYGNKILRMYANSASTNYCYTYCTTYLQNTYTSTLYADNAYISNYNNLIWTGTSAQYAVLDNYTTYQIYMIKES